MLKITSDKLPLGESFFS